MTLMPARARAGMRKASLRAGVAGAPGVWKLSMKEDSLPNNLTTREVSADRAAFGQGLTSADHDQALRAIVAAA